MRRFFTIVFSIFVLALLARAQDADVATSQAPPESNMTNVFVMGDSLAGGLGAGMKRLTQDDARYSVQMRYQEESGLARADFYDWPDAVAKIAASNKLDVAVVMIGSNDVRSIRTGELVHGFGTPEWTAAYAAEIDKLIASLKQTGAAVHWISLPPMANPEYDQSIAAIAGLQKARVEAAGIHYIDIRKDLVNADGSYMERGPDDTGAFRKLRDRDGVHFMKVGTHKIGSLVLAALTSGEQQPAPSAEVPQEAAGEAALPGTGPIFGQVASAGVINVIRPASEESVKGGLLTSVATGQNYADGSSAQRLFVKGQTPAAQPGRFDDFSFSQ